MRQRLGSKSVERYRRETGLDVVAGFVRGGTGHRVDLCLRDGSIVYLWPDGRREKADGVSHSEHVEDATSPDNAASVVLLCHRTIEAIERYGRQGMLVSVVFGPCGKYGCQYSVAVMDPSTGKEFEKPFAASSFADIATILDIEVSAMLSRQKGVH